MWFSVVCTLIDKEYTSSQWSKMLWTHNIKYNERNLCQMLLTIENSHLHALHYANELLVRVRLAFQKQYLFPASDKMKIDISFLCV